MQFNSNQLRGYLKFLFHYLFNEIECREYLIGDKVWISNNKVIMIKTHCGKIFF